MEKFYITTTLPYVNAKPHIGHAVEFVRADVFARYQKLMGKDVFLNTGTDEHGQKIYDKATEEGKDPQKYVDENAAEFKKLLPRLGMLNDIHFIRTTDEKHVQAAQEMWRRCDATGDIYKAEQTVKYCKGCELEKTDSELVDGKCPLHPNLEIELRNEENYFFRFSKYQDALLKLYENPQFVIPDFRLNEIKKFVEGGLQDFSISRLKSKMSWGVPVPGDDEHVMYVWFDALTSYLSTTGWPEKEDFGGYWPGIQFAGKDNLRQQSAIWQAMLLSAKLPTSKQIVIGGFITGADGQKMSKSLGNVIDPIEVQEKYGTETLRYFLMRHVHPFDDSPVTIERIHEAYNANLANGLGNLVSRVMKMAEDNLQGPVIVEDAPLEKAFTDKLDIYRFDEAMNLIFEHVGKGDLYIQETLPFKKVKSENPDEVKEGKEVIEKMVRHIYRIAEHLAVFMPETAEKIKTAVKEHKKPETLFSRID